MPQLRTREISRRSLIRAGVGAGVASATLAVAGCSASDAAPTGRVLRVSQGGDPKTLDPHKQGDMTSMGALINIFDTITRRDVDNALVAGLATDWKALSDNRWRFTLRSGVTFHNGEPLDAEAVKFSIERVINPDTGSPIVELRYVEKVEIVDSTTVDVLTSQPDPIIPEKLSLFGGVVVPPRHLAEVGDDAFAAHPVGSGPFSFVSFRRGVALQLVANDDYWDGRAGFDALTLKAIANPASALAALQSDEVDLVTGLTPDAALQLRGYRDVQVESAPGIRTSFISLDTTDALLSDRRVRQALNHAVDVDQLISAVLDGRAKETATLLPAEAFGHDSSIEPFQRDVAKARALLAEAGHPDGIDTVLTASNADAFVAQAIAGLMAPAGIRLRVELLEPAIYSSRLTSDNRRAMGPMYLAASTGWTLDGSSNLQSYIRSDRRRSQWQSERADALIDREELSMDPADRTAAFTELQELMIEEAPFVFLYQIDSTLVHTPKVRWRPNSAGVLDLRTAEVSA